MDYQEGLGLMAAIIERAKIDALEGGKTLCPENPNHYCIDCAYKLLQNLEHFRVSEESPDAMEIALEVLRLITDDGNQEISRMAYL